MEELSNIQRTAAAASAQAAAVGLVATRRARQAGRQAGRHAGMQAGRQAGREGGREGWSGAGPGSRPTGGRASRWRAGSPCATSRLGGRPAVAPGCDDPAAWKGGDIDAVSRQDSGPVSGLLSRPGREARAPAVLAAVGAPLGVSQTRSRAAAGQCGPSNVDGRLGSRPREPRRDRLRGACGAGRRGGRRCCSLMPSGPGTRRLTSRQLR